MIDLEDMRRKGVEASGLRCGELCIEAADEIERLRAERTELLNALRPFWEGVYNDNGDMTITPGGFDAHVKAYYVYRRLTRNDEQAAEPRGDYA